MALVPGASAAGGGVRIEVNGGGTLYADPSMVADAAGPPGDLAGAVRFTAGGPTQERDSGGAKLVNVLEAAGIPRDSVQTVAVRRGASPGSVTLSGDDLRDGISGGPDGRRDVTVFNRYNGTDVRFFRPLRDGGSDVNGDDSFTTDQRQDLLLTLMTTGSKRYTAEAEVKDATPKPGQPTDFAATVSGAPAGVTFDYLWDFGDGTYARTQAPSHAFTAGRYQVKVTARGSDDSLSVSAPVDVQVGTVAGEPTAAPTGSGAAGGPSTGTGGGGAGSGGGAATGGGTGNAGAAPTGPSKGARGGTGDGDRGKRKGRTRPSVTATPAATDPANQPTAVPGAPPGASAPPTAAGGASTGAGAGSAGAGGAPPAGSPQRTPGRNARPAPTGTPAPTPAASTTGGRPVDGVLLAGTGSPQEVADLLRGLPDVPAPDPAAAARRGGGGDGNAVLAWTGGSGALLLLLGAGAAREARGRLRARLAGLRR